MGLGWPSADDARLKMAVAVMTVVAIVTQVFNRDEVIITLMGTTV